MLIAEAVLEGGDVWLVLQETGSLDCFAVCDLAASVGRSCSIVWGCTAPPFPSHSRPPHRSGGPFLMWWGQSTLSCLKY